MVEVNTGSLTIEDIQGYINSHHLTRVQSRMASTCCELLSEREAMRSEIAALNKRLSGVQEYQQRANTKPCVLLVQDLSRHGAVTAYADPHLVATKRLVVYPWSTVNAELSRIGKPWVDYPMVEHLESPYEGELGVARAMELEAKRATIEGCDRVIAMKDALGDAAQLIKYLSSELDKHKEKP